MEGRSIQIGIDNQTDFFVFFNDTILTSGLWNPAPPYFINSRGSVQFKNDSNGGDIEAAVLLVVVAIARRRGGTTANYMGTTWISWDDPGTAAALSSAAPSHEFTANGLQITRRPLIPGPISLLEWVITYQHPEGAARRPNRRAAAKPPVV
jgi:hypothetical protein